jgi:hypothetical protein
MGQTPLVVSTEACHDMNSDDFQELQPSDPQFEGFYFWGIS